MVIRELVTGVCLHECKTFGKDEPLVLVQRVAGQLITPESWPGCGSQPHPKEEPFELSISDPIYKRVPWRVCPEVAQLLSRLLALRPEHRCTAGQALRSSYFQQPVVPRRATFKGAPRTPFKDPRLAGTSTLLPPPPPPISVAGGPGRPAPAWPRAVPAGDAQAGQPRPRQARAAATSAAQRQLLSGPPNPGPDPGPAGAAFPRRRLARPSNPVSQHGEAEAAPAAKAPRHVKPKISPPESKLRKLSLPGGKALRAAAPPQPSAEAENACQCKGSCGRGATAHPVMRRGDGQKRWYGPCRFRAQDGACESFCESCVCSAPSCSHVRNRGPFCHMHARQHQDRAVSLPVKALRILQNPLSKLLPMDLECFLHTATPDDHPAVLIIMALLWDPQAVQHFARKVGNTAKPIQLDGTHRAGRGWRLRADLLAAAVLDTLQEVGSSCCVADPRLFGPLRTAQKLRLIITHDEASPSRQPGKGTKEEYGPCRELLQIHPLPKPESMDQFAAIVLQLDLSLQGLGTWSGMNGAYIRGHVVRKVAMLYHHHCIPELSWRLLPREAWLACSPDVGGHLLSLPASENMAQLHQWAPQLPLILYSMWACLLAPALAEPAAAAWLGTTHASREFRRTADTLRQLSNKVPTPLQVIKQILADQAAAIR